MKWVWVCLLLAGCIQSGIPEETGTIEAFFCDQVDCSQVFAEKVQSASSVDCAIYHSNDLFIGILESKKARLVTDEEHPVKGAVTESGSGFMHNKFCVFDNGYVWTGSWNPDQEMTISNNAVLIQSKTLADAYRSEFEELFGGTFHKGAAKPGLVKLNGNLVEAYFCPEENCKQHVLDVLNTAQKSIHFMTFSFTDDDIGNLLVRKAQLGVDVSGVFHPRDKEYREYEKLKGVSNVIISKTHHKVFIIDSATVITGSYNPSRNANERNDENIIIIRDAQIAQQFENEFARFI